MLKAFVNAFRTPDLRRKLLFVLMIIVVFRAGSQIPAPGVDVGNVQSCISDVDNTGIYNLINLFSGGALLQLTIFALGIMPYITASIILQLLVVVIPRLEALKKEGQAEGEVPRVLGDLGLAGLALLLEGLQPRDHHHQQLQDDARRDVRHDPQREDRQLEKRPAGEQVDQVVEPGTVAFLGDVHTGLDVGDIDTRGRDLGSEPEDHDDHQDEQQLAPQVRGPESVRERAQHEILFLQA